MITRTPRLVVLTTWLVMSGAGAALAQSSENKAAASAAFDRAKQLMDGGDTEAACEQFARSQELDPQFGTQYNLALCYEQQGRIASAWLLFRDVAQLDSNAKRKKDSARRASALEPKLTRLLVTTTGATPGLVVTRDGVDVTRLVGVEDPIDPGHYQLVASAPGYANQVVDVEVHADKGAVVTVKIPALEEEAVEEPDHPDVTPDTHARRIEEPDDGPSPYRGHPGRGRKLAGIGVAGVGVVALGVGLVFGAKASSSWSEVEDLCGADLRCSNDADYQRAQGLVSDTRSAGNLSTILVGVGAVAVTAGVILWVTAPSGGGGEVETALRVHPEIGRDGASVVLAGGF
jgi:hypothetical protein